MTSPVGTITFRTPTQLAIWKLEITGQLSDGQWENARPYDHWKCWCNATAQVGVTVGRTFYARKTNYNLTDPGLLEVVGHRMIAYARLALAFPEKYSEYAEFLDMGGDLYTREKLFTYATEESVPGFWTTRLIAVLNVGGTTWAKIASVLSDESIYAKAHLRADLNEMKAAMKLVVRS